MPYISTDLNRRFAALETSYGTVPAFTPSSAFPALTLDVELEQSHRYLEFEPEPVHA